MHYNWSTRGHGIFKLGENVVLYGMSNISNFQSENFKGQSYAENLRIFRGRYIVGTLTNNANIII